MRRLFLLTVIALGIVISGYLLHRHFALSAREAAGGIDVCSAVFGRGCDDALASRWAVAFGLPLAGWSVVYYGTLLALALLGCWLDEGFRVEAHLASLVLAVPAAAASVALFGLMLTGAAPFCPLCAVLHGLNLLLVYLLWKNLGYGVGRIAAALAAAARYLVGHDPPDPMAGRWKLVGFLTVGLVAAILFQWVYTETALRAAQGRQPLDPAKVVASLMNEPVCDIPLDADDPAVGPADAPATLVVFSDLECPACRRFAGELERLRKQFPATLRVVFKDFPLDSQCNPAVSKTVHQGACRAAEAAEAARMQGKFWRFYQLLLASHSPVDDRTLDQTADRAGIEAASFAKDRALGDTAASVRADAALGARLGVDSTPAMFLNGRRFRDPRIEALEAAVAYLGKIRLSRADSVSSGRSPSR